MNGYNHSDVRTETLQGIPSSHLQNAANAPYIRLTSQSIEIGCSCGIDPGKPRFSLRCIVCKNWQAPALGYWLRPAPGPVLTDSFVRSRGYFTFVRHAFESKT